MIGTLVKVKNYISRDRLGLALFIANVTGAIVYVFASMASWAIPEERAAGINTVTGEPFVWATRTFPVFIWFGLINLLWISRLRKWRESFFLIATAMIWVIGVWIDFTHH